MARRQQLRPEPTAAEHQTSMTSLRTETLEVLQEQSQPMSLDDLAAALTDELDMGTRRIKIQLHHEVLPKLSEAGLVYYDANEHRCQDAVSLN